MNDHKIKRFDLERYSAGELTAPEAKTIEEHCSACQACTEYLGKINRERSAFLQVHPYSAFERAPSQARENAWYERFTSAIAMPLLRPVLIPACVILLATMTAVPFLGRFMGPKQQGTTIAYKGLAPQLPYLYKRNGAVYESAPGDLFKAGDKIQIFYASTEEQYLTLVSIDGRGAVSFYQPDARSSQCSIHSGVGTRLAYPLSIDLDTTHGAELVAAIFSPQPFDTAAIQQWAAAVRASGASAMDMEKTARTSPPKGGSKVLTLLLNKG